MQVILSQQLKKNSKNLALNCYVKLGKSLKYSKITHLELVSQWDLTVLNICKQKNELILTN